MISSSQNVTTFFCSSIYRFLLLSLGCHPLEGVTLHLFYLSDLVSPLFFVNLPTNFISFGCHPLEGVTRGGPPPRPPSDATDCRFFKFFSTVFCVVLSCVIWFYVQFRVIWVWVCIAYYSVSVCQGSRKCFVAWLVVSTVVYTLLLLYCSFHKQT